MKSNCIYLEMRHTAGASVIHPSALDSCDPQLNYQKKNYDAIGYCKLYWFDEDTDYLARHFVEGSVDAGCCMLWVADGNFGGADYLRMAYVNGRFAQVGDNNSFHRDSAVCADVEGEDYEIQIQGLGPWATAVKAEETRIMLRQGFCK